ncbi:MAG: CZB domain-containing protein [Gemmatimonadetes bacterium]|nr:CZB domain-containing protein [Gemmatimonadota bacterium]
MPHQQIAEALDDHAAWKATIMSALADGAPQDFIQAVPRPDACAFGKWLGSSEISHELRHSPRFHEAARLHAKFHDVAARTLLHVIEGRPTEAVRALSHRGEFTAAIRSFTTHAEAWLRELALEESQVAAVA